MVKIEVTKQKKKKKDEWQRYDERKRNIILTKRRERMIYNIIIIYNFEAAVGCQRWHSTVAWMLNIIAIALLMETHVMVWVVKK